MEGPNYLELLRDELVSQTKELQRFAQENVELRQILDEFEPGSPEAIEFAALLRERHELAQKWFRRLSHHWDRTRRLVNGIWHRQLQKQISTLDADLAELRKSRPKE
jgi:hypothetical protein